MAGGGEGQGLVGTSGRELSEAFWRVDSHQGHKGTSARGGQRWSGSPGSVDPMHLTVGAGGGGVVFGVNIGGFWNGS